MTVCMGDFNTFRGNIEIKPLLQKDKFSSLNEKNYATFPSFSPQKELDYALVSPDVNYKKLTVLPETFFDHRAIMFEINS